MTDDVKARIAKALSTSQHGYDIGGEAHHAETIDTILAVLASEDCPHCGKKLDDL